MGATALHTTFTGTRTVDSGRYPPDRAACTGEHRRARDRQRDVPALHRTPRPDNALLATALLDAQQACGY